MFVLFADMYDKNVTLFSDVCQVYAMCMLDVAHVCLRYHLIT